MNIWNNEEVKSLFQAVEECKKNQKSLKNAFVSHANKYKRKPNSVRNYYYMEVENLKNDRRRCQTLGVNLSLHEKSVFQNFDKSEEDKLVSQIETLQKQGLSVRSACLKLSKGDLTMMTRLQNKYQNIKRKESPAKQDNIIMFRQNRKVLTDSDITSLFMGLVRLIKKTSMEDAMEKVQLSSTRDLKQALSELEEKNKKIALLEKKIEDMKQENAKLMNLQKDKNGLLKAHFLKSKSSETNFDKKIKRS
ncbi:MAG: hypothetical protein K2K31_03150 [Clostridia bacterium]|nr:hypothetical protein [Clostridia bacterium]